MDDLQIRLFGGLHVTQAGTPLTRFISNKVPALLAYLAANPRPHPRDTLADLLWGDLPDSDAKNNLRQALSNLRKFVAPYLLVTRETVAFDTSQPYTLDVEQFARLAAADPTLSPTAQAHHLEQAVALYQGDFLADVWLRDAPQFEDWLIAQRTHWRELALNALHQLTDWHLQQRHHPQAISTANRLLALDPWREEAHRQLITALARNGQRAAALKQYETCRRLLDEELGLEPSAATRHLAERLKAVGTAPRHNLPHLPTSFLGRTHELDQIPTLLLHPTCRLLTLMGPGGVGKTRLAQEAARLLINEFTDGVWFVSLAPLSRAEDVITAIANALGVTFSGAAAPLQQLRHTLRTKELLLILDNVEHLLNQGGLDLISDILSHSRDIRLLVTSRERLNLQAETLLEMGGLPYPPATPVTGTTPLPRPRPTDFPAIQLLVERARQLQPDFSLEQQEQAAIRLCQLVDGLPLALELAITWIRTLSLTDIVAEIERATDFLATNLRDIPARHRSLRAVFDYSWQLLTPQEQEAYCRLACFRGGFTYEAAQAVAHLNLKALVGLVDKSLLRRGNNNRYLRHPLLLQFANDKLAENPALAAEVRQNHARYFGDFVQAQEPLIFGGRADIALKRVQPEMENLRQTWEYAIEQRDTTLINQMADCFMQIFDFQGVYQEGVALAERLIQALRPAFAPANQADALALGRAYGLSGAFHFRLGEYATALAHSQTSQQLIEPFRPHVAYGHALTYAGAAAFGLGDFPQVISHWQAAATAYHEAGSLWGETVGQGNLGEAWLALGNTAAAKECSHTSLALAQKLETPELIANALINLSMAAHQEKQYDQAETYAQQALIHHRQMDHTAHIANDLAVLANIASERRHHEQALDYLREGVEMLRRVGNRLYLVQRLVELGQAALSAHHLEEAEAAFQEALDDALTTNTTNIALRALTHLAELYYQQGQTGVALRVALFVSQQEGATGETRAAAEQFLHTLSAQLSPDQLASLPAPSQTLTRQVVKQLLSPAEPPPATWVKPTPPIAVQPSASRYVAELFLARGGMGELYRGRDTQTGETVAIKRLLPHLITPDSDIVLRFQREAEVLRQLDHPNIVRLIDTVEEGEQLLIVMEYVPGGSLRDWLDRSPRLPLARVLEIGLELADALARTHHLRIIHRDLKPANVLLAADGTPRLTDFGIARLGEQMGGLTTQGATMGTAAYMSPEACRGEPLDTRTDVWSFGVMLVEMFCGRNPFERPHFAATLTAILHDPLPDLAQECPDIPPPLAEHLQRLLTRGREQRPASMRAIAAELEKILTLIRP
ncbi:MAG: protein kinase [Chloroflexi bacterium]|nr:protein kinase [Chloroflexota bacterium]